ncbi:SUMF1/EgtB/PvdO family nonheme iron enzyme [Ideonella sp. DXS29W]|uniref:SUMF1/EgtB/PvdO family nonheme iron enzyme n=1 Tax=Ideonella lacteola TaxID=2984193 RepID=A0ABU9BW70_9BURK
MKSLSNTIVGLLCRTGRPAACAAAALTLTGAAMAQGQEVKIEVRGSQIAGPAQQDLGEPDWMARLNNWKRDVAGTRDAWWQAMQAWRQEQRQRLGHDGARYGRADLQWTQRSFVQPQAMVEDRYLYDPQQRRYTVDRYLDDLEKRYGGIDSVLIWPIYPNIGIDNRNQLDMLRDMPGGVPAVRAMVDDFHRRGVRVFFPVMPWDTGTRDEGRPLAEAAARLVAELGGDGINGDTMDGLPREYREAADATGHPIALEPELALRDDAMLAHNQLTWGYWETPFVPLVSKWKWLEPRHMVHVADRWATDRHQIFQAAFFNGTGIQSWENIWGWWNGLTPRDGEILRRISRIYRAWPELLVSADWTPHVATGHYGVYGSRFPLDRVSLWTLVNRNDFGVEQNLLPVEARPGVRYYDAWRGTELRPVRTADGQAWLDVPIEARGYGAVLEVGEGADARRLHTFLASMRDLSAKPLASYSSVWQPLRQTMVEVPSTAPAATAPSGMVTIPAGEFHFRVRGVEIEGENRPGMDVQYPWEDLPRREHSRRLSMKPFHIDRHPVTNDEYKRFVDATGYRPADDHHFLRHWQGGAPREGEGRRPVTWVSLDDARAYCQWAGKRLPHEWEWQYAAQGTDGRLYPWGSTWDDAKVPAPSTGRDLAPPPEVGRFPQSASPFGVEDLVGHVWQWTDEYHDEHTRAAIVRGGSHYRPQGAMWYFPLTLKLNEHGKYLLMAPAKDRAGTLGFRCVKDAV